ncbi:unnamed protein product [Spirodela intermedia]|uniref:Uncharacterized protein n=1 Tax=Spirodela intermedia TaxID=51605 RepID=A0A7I8JS04_SPIIN|nr:unnamed protein product [Spirodela intermedia]CAA6672202.1 unnamed protein product [Spirodela intermedia]
MGAGIPMPLRRLKGAVEKVKFLLSTTSPDGSTAVAPFKEPYGLLDVVSIIDSEEFYDAASPQCPSDASTPRILGRTMSSVWSEISRNSGAAMDEALRTTSGSPPRADDVDDRTENFIAIFRRHLEVERQISLELRYCMSNSFEGDLTGMTPPPPPPPLPPVV